MCGRYALTAPVNVIIDGFEVREFFETEAGPPRHMHPMFNIAPTHVVPVVRIAGSGERKLDMIQWGLVPWWTKERGPGHINARSESAATKPAFRDPMRGQRCLVPANGFYEWQKLSAKRKQPWYVHLRDDAVFAFAGLWDQWKTPEGKRLRTFAILTTQPNSAVEPIHDRMPVILDRANYEAWLDPDNEDPKGMLRPCPPEALEAYPVSTLVNSPKNDQAECLARVEPEGELF